MPKHSESRFLPYTPLQMYELVADVTSYPDFLPWVAAARVRGITPQGGNEVMEADLVVSFRVFRERFGSRVTLFPDASRIDTEYIDGPFRHMQSRWRFWDADGGCKIEFDVDFEFRNRLLQGAAGMFFHEAMQRIVRAFEHRARELYG